jgi:Tetratricopeptide repeat
MTRHVLPAALLCSIVGICMPVGMIHAQERGVQVEARAHFQRGVDFFKEGDFRAALIEFKRAYEIAPNYKVLYNLGQTSLELQDYASALRSFDRYLSDGGKEVPAARRTQVDGEIEKLKKRVARIEVTTNVPDAEIFVDDVSVGHTPLSAPVAVSAGRRKISALKGGLTSTRMVDVAGGDSTAVSLEILAPTAAPAAPRAPEPARTPVRTPEATPPPVVLVPAAPAVAAQRSQGNKALWVGITVTGALAAGTVATGIFTLRSKKDFDNTIARYGVEPQAVSDARSKTRTLALVTDILAGATVVAGGITVVSVLVGGGSSKEQAKALAMSVTPGGLVATGTF